jgi:chorismate lyase/3-hydroxybenzoate synthase
MSLPPSSPAYAPTRAPAACRVHFGASAARLADSNGRTGLEITLPVLAGARDEELLASAWPQAGASGGFSVWQTDDRLAGFAVADAGLDLEAAADDLYRRLFAVTRDLHLYRIWNYVPQINAMVGGLENYRRFCRGRSVAFEKHFGRSFQLKLPAASGVGTPGGPLAIAFLAGRDAPRHLENPRQVPAFQYPVEYGPRPPSFSRATVVTDSAGRTQLFLSGTAAIRGHATIGVGNLDAQLDCTVENLRALGETSGINPDLGPKSGSQRSFKIYVRHAKDFGRVQTHLSASLLRANDTVSYLKADLCRADLLVEIEGVVALG